LIENGGNVNQADNEGRTPLYVSSLNGHLKVVKYLIYKKADINQTTAHGITPLACAIHNNEIEVAKFLLRNKANIENTKLGLKKYGKLELIEILDILYKEMEKE
jgi:ankyrin repeat protein